MRTFSTRIGVYAILLLAAFYGSGFSSLKQGNPSSSAQAVNGNYNPLINPQQFNLI